MAKEKSVDLEAWETCLREAVLEGGARILERLLKETGCGRREDAVHCACGGVMKSVGLREKTLQTMLGPLRFARSLYLCSACRATRFPGDEVLGVEKTGFSPGVKRLMARAGSRTSFVEAEEDLQVYANLEVDRKEVERIAEGIGAEIEAWNQSQETAVLKEEEVKKAPLAGEKKIPILYGSFDGTGIPMRREELVGRKGKQENGEARTREVKLGCVFTQTSTDEEGRPIRDPSSTTYVGGIETSETFGWRFYAEAARRGLSSAEQVVLLTDGASYNKSIIDLHFPKATHIIDLYHALEHLQNLAKLLSPEAATPSPPAKWVKLLEEGKIEKLIKDIQKRLPRSGKRRQKALGEIRYFSENAERMRYQNFRKRGFFVGSGVIEAGCRTLIAQRLKKSGMFWSLPGANAIIASRCCQFSHRFEQFWEDRAAASPI